MTSRCQRPSTSLGMSVSGDTLQPLIEEGATVAGRPFLCPVIEPAQKPRLRSWKLPSVLASLRSDGRAVPDPVTPVPVALS